MLVDSHCHLNFKTFDDDRDRVIHRAREAGVTRILNPGIDLQTSHSAVELSESYPEVYAAVGVHPNEGSSWNDTTIEALRRLVKRRKVVAIGEIGLDYYRDRTPRDLQRHMFRQQLLLAADMGLPVVIHTRNKSGENGRAMKDMLAILEEWKNTLAREGHSLAERPGVLHSFSGDEASAERTVELGFLIGISGPVTFRQADSLRKVVGSTKLESILVETDAPFLTPDPYRGKRNEPAYVRFVAEKLAYIHKKSIDDVQTLTTSNAELLFKW